MTEEEWLRYEDPEPMIEVLDRASSATRRKSRLLSCAACFRLGQLIIFPQSQFAVQVAEKWVDGEATDEQLWEAWLAASPAQLFAEPRHTDIPEYSAAMAAVKTASPKPNGHHNLPPIWSALSVMEEVIEAVGRSAAGLSSADWTQDVATVREASELAAILRDIFGNPFRPVAFDPAWRTSTAVALAEGMYDRRDFGAIPILADALQDAGCEDEQILSHCRGDGPHVRGCWVVDLVLGKE